MKAMILAAGRGERMRPLSDVTPKPLLKVGNETLIERHIRHLRQAGITEIVINLHHLGEQIADHLGDGEALGVQLQYSREPELLETAGGIRRALPLIDPGSGPFLVVNGDLYTDFSFRHLPALADNSLAYLYLVENPAHHKAGDFSIGDNGLLGLSGRCYTFSGIGLYKAAFFDGMREGAVMLRELMLAHIGAGRIQGALFEGFWSDVGTPERLAALNHEFD
ncbi:MAG: nucleotidyltransferase family protein [Pseudomonadales bacterium]|nr:nucleotidyltransferase family protein [Pseudomonadales bacterium]